MEKDLQELKKNKRSLEDVEPLDNIYNYILGNPLNKNYKYIFLYIAYTNILSFFQ